MHTNVSQKATSETRYDLTITDLVWKNLSVPLQGKVSALHHKSLDIASRSSILDWNLMERKIKTDRNKRTSACLGIFHEK